MFQVMSKFRVAVLVVGFGVPAASQDAQPATRPLEAGDPFTQFVDLVGRSDMLHRETEQSLMLRHGNQLIVIERELSGPPTQRARRVVAPVEVTRDRPPVETLERLMWLNSRQSPGFFALTPHRGGWGISFIVRVAETAELASYMTAIIHVATTSAAYPHELPQWDPQEQGFEIPEPGDPIALRRDVDAAVQRAVNRGTNVQDRQNAVPIAEWLAEEGLAARPLDHGGLQFMMPAGEDGQRRVIVRADPIPTEAAGQLFIKVAARATTLPRDMDPQQLRNLVVWNGHTSIGHWAVQYTAEDDRHPLVYAMMLPAGLSRDQFMDAAALVASVAEDYPVMVDELIEQVHEGRRPAATQPADD
jgi:hypothetical protein